MIGTVIGIIFLFIIIGVIWWAVQSLLPLIPMGEPFATIVRVLMGVVLALIVIWVLWMLVQASGIMSASMPALNLHGR
jgi:hypothetical protein